MTMALQSTSTPGDNRRGRVAIGLVALAAFGPYVAPGLRTEQVAVYAMCLLLVAGPLLLRVRPNGFGAAVAGIWVLQTTLAAIGVIWPPLNTTRYIFGSAGAGLDNLILPLCAMLVAWLLLAAGADRARMVGVVCRVTVWAMVINTAVACWQFAGNELDLDAFYGAPEGGVSVADLAETMGRYSGAINQPAEAGILYSVALIGAVYLYRNRALLLTLTATAICAGGILTVSKIFLLIGLPVGVWQVIRATGARHRRYVALTGAVVTVYGLLHSGLLPTWAGATFLYRLLPGSGQDAVTLYTAGRFGDDSTLAGLTNDIMRLAPVLGFGGRGLQVPYDNAWVEALVINGLIGAALYTAVLAVLGFSWLRVRSAADGPEVRLSAALVVIVIGASTGVPALTANRAATVLWLLLTLLLLSRRGAPATEPKDSPVVRDQQIRTYSASATESTVGTSGASPVDGRPHIDSKLHSRR